MFAKSIRWRLLSWLAFLLVCILTGFGVTAYQLHRINQLKQIDETLERRVVALSSDVRGRGAFGRPPSRPPSSQALLPNRRLSIHGWREARQRCGLGLARCGYPLKPRACLKKRTELPFTI